MVCSITLCLDTACKSLIFKAKVLFLSFLPITAGDAQREKQKAIAQLMGFLGTNAFPYIRPGT